MSIEFYLAIKFLRSKCNDKFIAITQKFAFFGVAIGVATLIIVTSVMNGFRYEFMKGITGINGHIAIKSDYGNIHDFESIINSLKNINYLNAVPIINEQCLTLINDRYRGMMVLGINRDDILKNHQIKIIKGEISEDVIGVGSLIEKNLHVGVGDSIKIISTSPKYTAFGQVPRAKTFKIGFIFSTGLHGYDYNMIIMPLITAQKLFNYPKEVSDIQIFLRSPENINDAIKALSHKIGRDDLYISNWENSNKSLMNAVRIERNVMTLILALIILVAAFNIISCMVMLVKDKRKDIAILKTIGLNSESIAKTFLICGSIIGITGTLIGVVAGTLISINLENIKKVLEYFSKSNLFSGEIYFLLELPSRMEVLDIVLITIVSIIITLLATIYPAIKAGKQNPVEILRYE